MGQRITFRDNAASTGGELLRFDFWMRGGALPPPLHIHPRQEERVLVVSDFIERTFALDRAGHLSAKGRGDPCA